MIRFSKVSLCVAVVGAIAPLAHGVSFLNKLYNTGLDDANVKLNTAAQTQDNHYVLSSIEPQYFEAYAVKGYVSYWMPSSSDYVDGGGNTFASQWISPKWIPGGDAGEVNNWPLNQQFNYTLSFNLGAETPLDIKGQWMADNGSNLSAGLVSEIYVNDVATGQQIVAGEFPPFNNWYEFDLKGSYFNKGANTITFSVTNWAQDFGNPTGVRAVFTSAEATPEPFTLVLCFGALALGVYRGRARKV